MAVIKGTAVVFSTGAIGGIITHLNQSVESAKVAEKQKIKDNGGKIKAYAFHAFEKTLRLSIVPSSTTVALARAEMDTGMYTPGTTLTITDDSGTVIDGPYNVDSVTQRRTNDAAAILDIELSRGDEGEDTTTLVS